MTKPATTRTSKRPEQTSLFDSLTFVVSFIRSLGVSFAHTLSLKRLLERERAGLVGGWVGIHAAGVPHSIETSSHTKIQTEKRYSHPTSIDLFPSCSPPPPLKGYGGEDNRLLSRFLFSITWLVSCEYVIPRETQSGSRYLANGIEDANAACCATPCLSTYAVTVLGGKFPKSIAFNGCDSIGS